MVRFHGSIVALVTPLLENGVVDYQRFFELIDWHIAEKTDAIVVAGTTGESATLSFDEHKNVIEQAVHYAQKRVPVIAGTNGNATHEAIELTQCAEKVGADAALIVTPYYNRPTQEGLYQHFCAIAKAAANLPIILYNVPSRTACDLANETVARLSKIDNIMGLKDATGQIARLSDLQPRLPSGFTLLTGDDATALGFFAHGGHGVISVTANVAPKLMRDFCQAMVENNLPQARAIFTNLFPLHQALFLEANPIPVKWALARMQKINPYLRLPLTPLSERYHVVVEQALKAAGCL